MRLPLTFILFFKLNWGLPIDTVILFQRSGVVGEMDTVEQVLVNGAPLSSCGKYVSGILRAVLLGNDSESFQQAFEMEENVTNTITKNPTYQYLRVRECKLNGFRVVHLTDQLLVNGSDFLTLDQSTVTWTAEVPQALALKQLWDWDTERTRRERMQLHESCTELMKELTHSEPTTNRAGMSLLTVLAPLLASLAFVAVVIASFLIANRQDPRVSGHPGGVLGSIVHYPQNVTETPQAPQSGKDYQVL
ncbi:uncharacterized protein si:dkeyp-13a3.10 isoform X1 [Salmo salar]|uniref:Uncharacterized protein si:dkeyp-13a3.10 isoform X1 n=1 Tax=Salmo salar TaxID=8030 RepID=A0A1S3LWW7_SALSA|nr:uncharacterized protein si:dkeyp-13a3.10 isoform X1 [Salmo salar]|eukprot:XP_013995094.1 PREDICTED: uncharacterized protein LOC106568869 isoform X1 [Salmo salar]